MGFYHHQTRVVATASQDDYRVSAEKSIMKFKFPYCFFHFTKTEIALETVNAPGRIAGPELKTIGQAIFVIFFK